jgi:excisionase family DNA binding protein
MSAITAPPPSGEGAPAARSSIEQAAELLDIRQAAELLHISTRHLWRLIDRGQGPPIIRLGRSVRVPRQMLARWLEDAAGRPRR